MAAMDEVRRRGDRDIVWLCNESRDIVIRRDASAADYYRALRNATRATDLAPWSAYCVGTLAMAKYRTGDYAGALDTFSLSADIRSEPLPAELAFKGMALHRLGRTSESAAIAKGLNAIDVGSQGATLRPLIIELNSLVR